MIPGSDPDPPQSRRDCLSCRLIGCAVLSGSGVYAIYSSLFSSDPFGNAPSSSASTSTSSAGAASTAIPTTKTTATSSGAFEIERRFPKQSFPFLTGPALGIKYQNHRFARTALGAFGVLLVGAGLARGYGITHKDVLGARDRWFSTSSTSPSSSTSTSS